MSTVDGTLDSKPSGYEERDDPAVVTRLLLASGLMLSPCSACAAQAERSARRTTVRATCRWAPPTVPPERMKERSFSSGSL